MTDVDDAESPVPAASTRETLATMADVVLPVGGSWGPSRSAAAHPGAWPVSSRWPS